VIEQAWRWIGLANWVSVGVPATTRRTTPKGRHFAEKVLRSEGIGLLAVNHSIGGSVDLKIEARLNRKALRRQILRCLCEEHKTFAVAGSAEGYHWSPYTRTCRELAIYVAEHPGCRLKDAIAATAHHYASDTTARSCIATWIRHGKVPGISWVDDEPKKGLQYDPSKDKHAVQPDSLNP